MAHILVQLGLLGAPEPDKISRKKDTPTVALLFGQLHDLAGFSQDRDVYQDLSAGVWLPRFPPAIR